jgi:hypothetical protein
MTNDLKWRLPMDLLAESVHIMQPCGARGHEGLAMWLGVQHDHQVDITHVVALRGAGLQTAPLQIRLRAQPPRSPQAETTTCRFDNCW